MRSVDLEADPRQLGEPVRVLHQERDDLVAVLRARAAPRARRLMPCVKRKVSTSRIVATSRQATIARSTLFREIARPGFRAHLAQPLGVAVELLEDVARPRSGRRSPGRRSARCRARGLQPEGDALLRLRQRRPERLDGEPPAVPRVLGERPVQMSCSPGLTCPSGAGERTGSPSRSSPSGGRPDGNSASGGDVARARLRERDADLGGRGGQMRRKATVPHRRPGVIGGVGVGGPHPSDDTRGESLDHHSSCSGRPARPAVSRGSRRRPPCLGVCTALPTGAVAALLRRETSTAGR